MFCTVSSFASAISLHARLAYHERYSIVKLAWIRLLADVSGVRRHSPTIANVRFSYSNAEWPAYTFAGVRQCPPTIGYTMAIRSEVPHEHLDVAAQRLVP